MIFGFLRKNNGDRAAIDRQYGLLTAAARQPAFYRVANVPDTVMGRFEMLSVVMILYFRRTASAGKPVKDIAQAIVDAFFQDLDHSMRELGIGDQGVPKRMKKFASMFYGRVASYGKALDAGDENALVEALMRNFHPETADSALSMQALAHYMVDAEAGLAATAETVLEQGQAGMLDFEDGDHR